ncbi:LADA_0C04830g1_1 [Lachancea dasiensis]|uniref:LADA_0C04830g1_1 n=1 Tax=Lachancea dasiensis TaxID=1072105 RepID=A0A1G4IZE2_9SACH|nr:LADA_0C04830g1_1 [Lachancea dasiensis]
MSSDICNLAMSEQNLIEFLSKGFLTNIISPTRFKDLISTLDEHLTEEQIEELYRGLRSNDEDALDAVGQRIRDCLVDSRSQTRKSVELNQLRHTVSVDDLVRSLYTAHQLLDGKIQHLDSTVQKHSAELKQLGKILRGNQVMESVKPPLERLKVLLEQAAAKRS